MTTELRNHLDMFTWLPLHKKIITHAFAVLHALEKKKRLWEPPNLRYDFRHRAEMLSIWFECPSWSTCLRIAIDNDKITVSFFARTRLIEWTPASIHAVTAHELMNIRNMLDTNSR